MDAEELYDLAEFALVESWIMRSQAYRDLNVTPTQHITNSMQLCDTSTNTILGQFTIDSNLSVSYIPAENNTQENTSTTQFISRNTVERIVDISTSNSEPPQEEANSTSENQDTTQYQETLLNETTLRFSGAEWYDIIKNLTVTCIGIGGIGSWTSLLVSRLNPSKIVLIDNDSVDSVNMAGQLYSKYQINHPKVRALDNTIESLSNYVNVEALDTRILDTSNLQYFGNNILVCGFDNMVARKIAFNKWIEYINTVPQENKSQYLFIDGRLSAEKWQIFCITADNKFQIDNYKTKYLFSDSEAEETTCSYKQTSYCAAMIGAFINNLIVNFAYNLKNPDFEWVMPFLTEYDAHYMYLKNSIK